jgi:hypothetical protein
MKTGGLSETKQPRLLEVKMKDRPEFEGNGLEE